MAKSLHLQRDLRCRSRIAATRSEHSNSFAASTTASTGGLGKNLPSRDASSSRAEISGERWYLDPGPWPGGKTSGFLEIRAKADFKIVVVERRFFSKTTIFASGKCS